MALGAAQLQWYMFTRHKVAEFGLLHVPRLQDASAIETCSRQRQRGRSKYLA